MSWLQRILDRDPHNSFSFPEDAGTMNRLDSHIELPFISGKPDFSASGTENNAANLSDGCTISKKSILIVEDEAVVAEDIKETLKNQGYTVTGIAKSGEDALEMVREHAPDLVLMDIHLATAMDGIETAGKIRMIRDIPVIYLTAYADKLLLDRAKVTEPFGYIIKPYDERELQSTIEIAFYKHNQDLQLREAYGELEQLIDERTEELNQINSSLAESERRYRSLFEGVPIGLYRAAPSGRILDINPALMQILGYPDREMLLEVRIPDFFVNADGGTFWPISSNCEQNIRGFEAEVRRYDGTIIWVRGAEKSVRNDNGQIEYYQGHIEDITDKKCAELALRESEVKHRILLEESPDPIFSLTAEGKFTYANRALVNVFGKPANEIIGRTIRDFYAGREADNRVDALNTVFQTGEKNVYEGTVRTPDGDRYYVTTINPIKNDEGTVISAICSSKDITERRTVEEELRESEELSHEILNNANDAIFLIEKSPGGFGKYLLVNEKSTRMLGYSAEELLQMSPRDIVPADIQKKIIPSVRKKLDTEGFATFESVHTRKDGSTYPVEVSTHMFQYKGMDVDLSIARDITGRKAAETALRESELRYRNVVEDQTEFICRFLPDGRLTFINESYCIFFGLNREECIGKRHSVVLPPDDIQQMKNHLAALTPENPVASISHRIVLPTGEVRWQHWSDRALYDDEGNVIEYQSVGRDITDQKEIETQLTNYQDTLEHRVRERTSELSRTNQKLKREIEDRKTIQKKLTISSNEKDLLLGEVHHRVKNNLQLIIGLIDLTKTRAHEPAVISTLTDIIVKVQTMGLVHTQLYESKRFDMINMKQQINALVEMISGFYDHEYLDVTRRIDCDEIYLPVDQAIPCALALNEIISNILKHAFKGRRNGHIGISSLNYGEMIRFVIQDNGVGLPSGFDIEKSNRLGLRLMRTLVEQQLHGSVTITSKAGTEVVIEFPMNQGEPEDGTCTDS